MANGKQKSNSYPSNGGNLGFEAEMFKAADELRGNMEPPDYKHVALDLIFLKYISVQINRAWRPHDSRLIHV